MLNPQNPGNNDFYFISESFKIFFEKIVNIISDPSGLVLQEWNKYKNVLFSKDYTPSAVYYYSYQLSIKPNQAHPIQQAKETVNHKKEEKGVYNQFSSCNSFEQDNKSNNILSLRNSLNSKEIKSLLPSHSTKDGSSINSHQQDNIINTHGINSSPWIERSKKRCPTQRITTQEIQQLKGLNDINNNFLIQSKQNEEREAGRKVLLGKVHVCLEQFKKDSVGLDLIKDRSFQTQTMLVDSMKRTPDKNNNNGKRLDAKYIREYSIYSKNQLKKQAQLPSQAEQQTFQTPQQQQQVLQQSPLSFKSDNQPSVQQANKTPTSALPVFSTNAINSPPQQIPSSDYAYDFVKSKNLPITATYNNFSTSPLQNQQKFFTESSRNFNNSTQYVNNLSSTPNYANKYNYNNNTNKPQQQQVLLYGQSKQIPSSPNSTSNNSERSVPISGNANGINVDELVQKILKEQKSGIPHENQKSQQKNQQYLYSSPTLTNNNYPSYNNNNNTPSINTNFGSPSTPQALITSVSSPSPYQGSNSPTKIPQQQQSGNKNNHYFAKVPAYTYSAYQKEQYPKSP